jgi:capsular polysaccharide biosynthesis protein
MEKKYDETLEIDIRELARSLIHKWWLIILVGFLVSAGTFAYSYFLVEPIYTSLTKVYVINRQDGNRMTLSDLQTGTQLTKDYLVLVKSTPVLQQIIDRMGLSMTQEELAELVQI